jgi:hypothetical protein
MDMSKATTHRNTTLLRRLPPRSSQEATPRASCQAAPRAVSEQRVSNTFLLLRPFQSFIPSAHACLLFNGRRSPAGGDDKAGAVAAAEAKAMGDAPVAADTPTERPDDVPKQLAEVLNEEEGEEEALAFADRSVNARSKRLNKAFSEKRTEVRECSRQSDSFVSVVRVCPSRMQRHALQSTISRTRSCLRF